MVGAVEEDAEGRDEEEEEEDEEEEEVGEEEEEAEEEEEEEEEEDWAGVFTERESGPWIVSRIVIPFLTQSPPLLSAFLFSCCCLPCALNRAELPRLLLCVFLSEVLCSSIMSLLLLSPPSSSQ